MNTELYDRLGLKPGCSKGEIKKAYRTLARKYHPDNGGSAAQFNRLKQAYDILKDEARRNKYDQTGDFSESTPDNSDNRLNQMIADVLERSIMECVQRGAHVENTDLIKDCVNILKEIRNSIGDNLKAAKKQREILMSAKDRFYKGENQDNFLNSVIRAKIATCDEVERITNETYNYVDKAIAIFEEYRFAHTKILRGPKSFEDLLGRQFMYMRNFDSKP